jgi:hypothetical protein
VSDVDVDVDGLELDQPLTLTWQPLDDGRAIPAFQVAGAEVEP